MSLDGRKKSVGSRISVSFPGLGEDLCAAHEAEALLCFAWIVLRLTADRHHFSWAAPCFISGFPSKDFTALCCSSGSPPTPKGERESCLSSLGFHTLLQCRQGGQIGHFTPWCTIKAAQLGVQVCWNDLACTSSVLSCAVYALRVFSTAAALKIMRWSEERDGKFPGVSCECWRAQYSKNPPINNFCHFAAQSLEATF